MFMSDYLRFDTSFLFGIYCIVGLVSFRLIYSILNRIFMKNDMYIPFSDYVCFWVLIASGLLWIGLFFK